jgi:hypothetical protein
VKVQGDSQVLDRQVVDADGRRLGRIVAVGSAPDDSYNAAWFVLRLRRWRRRLRAVPADRATWRAGGDICVPFSRDVVLASPALTDADLDNRRSRSGLEAFYEPAALS